jgi:hypothetical protein
MKKSAKQETHAVLFMLSIFYTFLQYKQNFWQSFEITLVLTCKHSYHGKILQNYSST